MKCDFGGIEEIEESEGCQEYARYLLQYSVDWRLLEGDPNHIYAADMERYGCEKHLLDIGFVFDPNHGLPQRILDLKEDKERVDLVEKIASFYEGWRQKEPTE